MTNSEGRALSPRVDELSKEIEALTEILDRHQESKPGRHGGLPSNPADPVSLRKGEDWVEEDSALRMLLGRRMVELEQVKRNPPPW